MVRHAVDGTKLHAAGSSRRAVNQEILRKRIEHLDKVIQTIETEIEQTRESEEGLDADTLSEELHSRQALRARIEKELKTAEPELRTHPDEPEARLMKGVGLGYNAQIVTDLKAGIIVAADVVNDTNDVKQLVPMLDQVNERFERVADTTLADGGYHSGEAIAAAEEKNYNVVVAPGQHEEAQEPYHVSQFTYDPSSDTWQCPENQTLTYLRTRQGKNRPAVRLYSNPAACRDCPVRLACTKNPRGREIELNPNRAALERHRLRREQNRPALRFRMLVEHAFARIKHRFGFRRFRFGGLEKANLEWKFMTAVNNFAIIMDKIRPVTA